MPTIYYSSCSYDSEPLLQRIVDDSESFLEQDCFLQTGGNSFDPKKIRDRLASCDALIVVIGEGAIPLKESLLSAKENIVMERIRFEIVTAINLNLIIVPLLLGETIFPEKRNAPGVLKRLLEYRMYRLKRDFRFEELHQLLEDIEGELEFKDEVEKKLSEPFQFNFMGRDETTGNLSEAHRLGLESCGPSEFERAIDSENLILSEAQRKGDRAGEKNALSALGLTFARLGQTQKAIHYFQKQLVIVRELKDVEEECGLLANLGDAFAISGNIEQAKKYYQEQLSLAQPRDYCALVGSAYNGLGFVCVKQGEIADGVDYYLKALAIYKDLENHDKELELLVGIGLNYQKLGKLKQTIEFLQQALQVSRYVENRREEARILVDLAEAFHHRGNLERVDFYLTQAEGFLFDLEKPWVDSLVKRLRLLRGSLKSE